MEDQYIQIANKGKEYTYKLTGAEKVCLDSYMAARNNKLLLSKGSMDVNGKSTLSDEIGRPIVATEGKKFAPILSNKYGNKLFNSVNPEMGIPSQD